MKRRKRQPYRYRVNGEQTITSWRKIYVIDGVPCHKRGEFYEPVPPRLAMQISLAQIERKDGGQ